MYHALNRKRNGIVSAGEVSLWEKEQEAWAKTTGRVHPNADRISPLSHKTIATLALPLWHCRFGIATRAELGWIGKTAFW